MTRIKTFFIVATLAAGTTAAVAGDTGRPKVPSSLEAAYRETARMHSVDARTFECGCRFVGNTRAANFGALKGECGYAPRAADAPMQVIWTHVVSPETMAQGRACYASGHPDCTDEQGRYFAGARCCARVDPEYQAMLRDLHNLVPMVAEIDTDRDGRRWGEARHAPDLYGECAAKIDFGAGVIEPAPERRGDIARIHLYMRDVWGLRLSPSQVSLYARWSREDPPDAFEMMKNESVTSIQGVQNPYIPLGRRNQYR